MKQQGNDDFEHVAATTTLRTTPDPPTPCPNTLLSTYPYCRFPHLLPTGTDGSCEFNLMTDTSYLPQRELVECTLHRAARNWNDDVMGAEKRIATIQNPKDGTCSDRDWHLVKWTSHGHGHNVFALAWMIGNHWDRGVPVLASQSAYRFGDWATGKCDGRGWSCHLSTLSNMCSLNMADMTKKAPMPNRVWNFQRVTIQNARSMDKWCTPNGQFNATTGRCECNPGYVPTDGFMQFGACRAFPASFLQSGKHDVEKWAPRMMRYSSSAEWRSFSLEHWICRVAPGEVYPGENNHHYDVHGPFRIRSKHSILPPREQDDLQFNDRLKVKYGFFWWLSFHLWTLHKHAPKRSRMETLAIGILGEDVARTGECVAVHVRRGDSCNDPTAKHRKCPHLSEYSQHVKNLFAKYAPDTKRVVAYLATDDQSAIDEALDEIGSVEYKWQEISRARYTNGFVVDNNPSLFGESAVDELMLDVWAMSFCRLGMVVAFSSSVSWSTYAFMMGRWGTYLPFVSVDYPWGHPILGGLHAKENVFDGTVDASELNMRRKMFGH